MCLTQCLAHSKYSIPHHDNYRVCASSHCSQFFTPPTVSTLSPWPQDSFGQGDACMVRHVLCLLQKNMLQVAARPTRVRRMWNRSVPGPQFRTKPAEPSLDQPKPSRPTGNIYCCRTLIFGGVVIQHYDKSWLIDYMAGLVLSAGDIAVNKNRYSLCPREAYISNKEEAMRAFDVREVGRTELGKESKKLPCGSDIWTEILKDEYMS